MKTRIYRMLALGITVSCLAFSVGCKEESANRNVNVVVSPAPATVIAPADLSSPAPSEPPVGIAARPAEGEPPPAPPLAVAPAPGAPPAGTPLIENTEVPANAVPPDQVTARLVQPPVPLETTTNSPALGQVVRMVQAGISEGVILTYITNSSEPFNVGSEQLIYLNDLGVSAPIMTALVQHDGSMAGKGRTSTSAAPPLPPGVTLPSPAPAPGASVPADQVPGAMPASYEQTAPVTTVAPESAPPPAPTETPQTPVTVNYFYNYLTPYGSWVSVDGYGVCWQPTVAVVNVGWRPYGDCGRWVWTDNGWYWYSEYSWGWVPFHYGRWCHRPHVGWFWVPDTHWGPAWVSWRYSSDYCGWAPLPPEVHYHSGVGLTYYGRGFSVGFEFGLAEFSYTYIPTRRFCDPRPHLYYVARHDVHGIHQHTTVINNYTINKTTIINNGINVQHVQKVAGNVPRATIHDRALPSRPEGRIETLKTRGNTLVVEKPTLPKAPPPAPRLAATTTKSTTQPNPKAAAQPPVRTAPGKAPSPVVPKSSPISTSLAPSASPKAVTSAPAAAVTPPPNTRTASTGGATVKPATTPMPTPEPAKIPSATVRTAPPTPEAKKAPASTTPSSVTATPKAATTTPTPKPATPATASSREVYKSPADQGRSSYTPPALVPRASSLSAAPSTPAAKPSTPGASLPPSRMLPPHTGRSDIKWPGATPSPSPSASPRVESRPTYSAPAPSRAPSYSAPSASRPAPSRAPAYTAPSSPAPRATPSSGGSSSSGRGRSGNGKNDR